MEPGGNLNIELVLQNNGLAYAVGNTSQGQYALQYTTYGPASPIGLIASHGDDTAAVGFDNLKIQRTDWLSPVSPTWQVYGGNMTVSTANGGTATLGSTDNSYLSLALREGWYDDDYQIEAKTLGPAAGVAFRIQDKDNYYFLRTSNTGPRVALYRVANGQLYLVAYPFVTGINSSQFQQWYITTSGSNLGLSVNVNMQGWQDVFTTGGSGAGLLAGIPAGGVGLASQYGGMTCQYLRIGQDGNGDRDLADAGEAWINEEFDSLSSSLAYDDAGNLTDDGLLTYQYDAWNRLTAVYRKTLTSTLQVAGYSYDGLGRRVQKVVTSSGNRDRTEVHRYAGWQLLQIDSAASAPQKQFVWGSRYIDEAIAMYSDLDGDGDLLDPPYGVARYGYMQDANYNVVCLRRASYDGVSERYEYDAYGVARIYRGFDLALEMENLSVVGESLFGNPIRYAGYFHDNETGLCHVRHRVYSPSHQRWLQRDIAGYVDGPNRYGFMRYNPFAGVDPSGTETEPNPMMPPGGHDIVPVGPGRWNPYSQLENPRAGDPCEECNLCLFRKDPGGGYDWFGSPIIRPGDDLGHTWIGSCDGKGPEYDLPPNESRNPKYTDPEWKIHINRGPRAWDKSCGAIHACLAIMEDVGSREEWFGKHCERNCSFLYHPTIGCNYTCRTFSKDAIESCGLWVNYWPDVPWRPDGS